MGKEIKGTSPILKKKLIEDVDRADFIARAKKKKVGATQKNPPTSKSPFALKEGGKV